MQIEIHLLLWVNEFCCVGLSLKTLCINWLALSSITKLPSFFKILFETWKHLLSYPDALHVLKIVHSLNAISKYVEEVASGSQVTTDYLFIPSCVYVVVEVDSIAPVIFGCPQSSTYTVEFGTTSRVVTWTEPTATDNSGGQPTGFKSHQPGERFPDGTTQVTYIFSDQSQNSALCSFAVMGKLISIFRWFCLNM